MTGWESSAHNAMDTEAFRHWDKENPAEIPAACAKCHTSAGYQDCLGADGSTPNVADKPVLDSEAQGIECVICHNAVASNLNRVTFAGYELDKDGNLVPYVVKGLGHSWRYLVWHQGGGSRDSVDAQTARFEAEDAGAVIALIKKDDKRNDVTFGFRNIHNFAAATTLYRTEVKAGYEYGGQLYDAKFDHAENRNTVPTVMIYTLQIKVNEYATCHGNGVKAEGGSKDIRVPSFCLGL